MTAFLHFLAEWSLIALGAWAGWYLIVSKQEREDEIEREDRLP